MKIVITGALGHIGSHIIREFPTLFDGAEIVMIDNMMTQRYTSLFNLPRTGRYRFLEADVLDIDLRRCFDGADAVIHLAAITDAASSFERAAAVELNNYGTTTKIADACVDTGAPLVLLSSTSVYGTQASLVAEDCPVHDLKPQSPYAETKLKEEDLVQALGAQRGLKTVVCRFGTIFGTAPGMRFHTAVNKFCWQAMTAQPLSVWSTAYEQKRPYLDIIDAGRALAFIIGKKMFDGAVYNVVTLNATVRQIVDAIRLNVPDLAVDFVDSPIMNQLSYEVSAERIRAKGFEAVGDLARGIDDTLALLRGLRRAGMAL